MGEIRYVRCFSFILKNFFEGIFQMPVKGLLLLIVNEALTIRCSGKKNLIGFESSIDPSTTDNRKLAFLLKRFSYLFLLQPLVK